VRVAKWGNSLAVRLPADVVEALGLSEGDDIKLIPGQGGLTVERRQDRIELLLEARKYRGTLPKDYVFSREEANARGPTDQD
jgi:antitoxin MazE